MNNNNNGSAPGVSFWVVREPLGRFVRAFLTEGEAQYYAQNTRWAVSLELTHEPDEDGNIFPVYIGS